MTFAPNIQGYQPDSFSDWPGKLTPVIFMGGCNFRCPTCHNHVIAFNPSNKVVDLEVIRQDLSKKSDWYEGITISGGEAPLATGFEILLRTLREEFPHLPIKVDTNGLRPDLVLPLFHECLINTLAIDIKGPFQLYPTLAGCDVEIINVRNAFNLYFKLAEQLPDRFIFRTTMVPALTPAHLDEIREMVPSPNKILFQKFIQPEETC